MLRQIKQACMAFFILTLITGVIYPLIITGINQLCFSDEANGSLIIVNQQVIGSSLIGQDFSSKKYLWSRPSATTDSAYNPLASGGSNLGPSSQDLLKQVHDRVVMLAANNSNQVPIDLVTSSASGLDPNISIAAAYFQMKRIAQARNVSVASVKKIIDGLAIYPRWGIWGEPRVNVLAVNLKLDTAAPMQR